MVPLRGAPEVPPLCRETQSLGQQMLNAPFGINGLRHNDKNHSSVQSSRFAITYERLNLKMITSLGSPHFQTQLQAVPVLSSLYSSLISFSSFTFPSAPYRIFFLFLPLLPCHFILLSSQQQPSNIYIFPQNGKNVSETE